MAIFCLILEQIAALGTSLRKAKHPGRKVVELFSNIRNHEFALFFRFDPRPQFAIDLSDKLRYVLKWKWNLFYRAMSNGIQANPEFNRLRICFTDGELRKSIFWLSHSNDGSLMVEIPYSSTSAIYYGSFKLPKNQPPADICYADFGQLTDVCPKFVYHNSGECHFSKTGKMGSEFKIQSRPIMSIDRQTHIFTFYLNGLPESFRDFDESKTKKKDLKEHNFNVVFSAPAIRLAPDARHRIKMMIEPDENFYEKHGLKPGRNFYKASDGGYVFVYNLTSNHRRYKCLLAYKELETGQSDEHFVFFGAIDPHDGSHGDDVSFIVGNC